METINQLRPVQINDLTHIKNIQKLSVDDEECLDELRRVLEKHNRLSKFGITLLHKHFDLNPDELLVESCDTNNKTLTAKPIKITDLKENRDGLIETIWRFDGINGKSCQRYCPVDSKGNHYGYKEHD